MEIISYLIRYRSIIALTKSYNILEIETNYVVNALTT